MGEGVNWGILSTGQIDSEFVGRNSFRNVGWGLVFSVTV